MRIPIREQLSLLIALTSLLALMILAVATWVQSHSFILSVRSSQLAVTANLKAAQISQNIQLYQESIASIATRTYVQVALQSFNEGNNSNGTLDDIREDLLGALSGGGRDALFLQAIVFPRSNATPGNTYGLVNVTGDGAIGKTALPWGYLNGTGVILGDEGPGYPPPLYPNFTYTDGPDHVSNVGFNNRTLYYDSSVILGPLYINATSSLISITVAINNNTSRTDILGWLTVVIDARLLYSTLYSPEGLGATGEAMLVGPFVPDNLFPPAIQPEGRTAQQNEDVLVTWVLPPISNSTLGNRHNLRQYGDGGNPDLLFTMGSYPAVLDVWSKVNGGINNAGSLISTNNEQDIPVSVGYAQINSDLVDWGLIFEQSHSEVYQPIYHLRDIVLACVFSVIGAILLVCFPLAHLAVRPIQQLRYATQKSITQYEADTPEPTASSPDGEARSKAPDYPDLRRESSAGGAMEKGGFFASVTRWMTGRTVESQLIDQRARKRIFRIPERVPEKRHMLHDELTDLIETFNEMSDELTVQYARLEERVKARTAELEASRNSAQQASESKTLFIANISHELRTPLNGILGMCTVAVQEDELPRVRQALKIIHKSGDLLLHLLNDLLTFSRNSYGQQLVIEDNGFRISDISTQLGSIFEKQAREKEIDLRVVFSGPEGGIKGPSDTGPVPEMSLRGDKNRILQILMNLVSNSLKFTPEKGSIELRIKCIGWVERAVKVTGNIDTIMAGAAVQPEEMQMPMALKRNVSAMSISPKDLLFHLEVEDTGPGIPDHLQQEIFKPFVQGDLALSKKYGGTGLGLTICAQLATLMGGKITLKSTISVGSTFTLAIPLRYMKEQASSVSSSLVRPGSKFSGSKPNSLVGPSLYDEPRSARLSARDPSPRGSTKSAREARPLDVPRIVGFSQPYLTDYDASGGNEHHQSKSLTPSKGGRPSTPLPRVSSGHVPTRRGSDPIRPSSIFRNDGPPTPKREAAVAPAPAEKTRVLVAEDNKVNQEVILRMLRLEKVQDVTLAQDGKEALDIVKGSMNESSPHFGLVFMDIQMPNMDGIQSTKAIRELGFSAPIVALTAFADDSNRKDCMDVGMNFFLPKPVRRTALKQVLKQFSETIHEEDHGDGGQVTQNGQESVAPADIVHTLTPHAITCLGKAQTLTGLVSGLLLLLQDGYCPVTCVPLGDLTPSTHIIGTDLTLRSPFPHTNLLHARQAPIMSPTRSVLGVIDGNRRHRTQVSETDHKSKERVPSSPPKALRRRRVIEDSDDEYAPVVAHEKNSVHDDKDEEDDDEEYDSAVIDPVEECDFLEGDDEEPDLAEEEYGHDGDDEEGGDDEKPSPDLHP